MSATAVRSPAEFERAPALPLRAVRGRARRPRRREGDVRAGRDRRPLRRPLQPRAARGPARGRGGRRTGTSASGCTGCARPARPGSSRPSWPSATTRSRTRSSPRGSVKGEEMPLRSAQARLAVLPEYRDRDELGAIQADAPRRVQPRAARAAARARSSRRSSPGSPIRCAERGGEGDLAARARAHARGGERRVGAGGGASSASAGSSGCSGRSATRRRRRRTSRTCAGCRRSRRSTRRTAAVDVCMATLDALGFALADDPNIRLDLDDRPQKSPRACVIASDPPHVVHLITRAQGGLHDYQAFLHEAGHALHYAGFDPSLPYTFRHISRDHALTEIYSYIVEAISREPALARRALRAVRRGGGRRTPRRRRSSRRCSSAATRRSCASSSTSGRASPSDGGTPDGYAERLTAATGVRYRRDAFLADMDAGFYSADYLRAWIRSAQLRRGPRARGRRRLVAQPRDRRAPARALPRGHAPDQRGDRGAARLRAARHRSAARGADAPSAQSSPGPSRTARR